MVNYNIAILTRINKSNELKLIEAISNKKQVNLVLTKDDLFRTYDPNEPQEMLFLSSNQYKTLSKVLKTESETHLLLSYQQLLKMMARVLNDKDTLMEGEGIFSSIVKILPKLLPTISKIGAKTLELAPKLATSALLGSTTSIASELMNKLFQHQEGGLISKTDFEFIVKVDLSKTQQQKIFDNILSETEFIIQLAKNKMTGNDELALTKELYEKYQKNLADDKGVILKFPKDFIVQMANNDDIKTGGFINLLLEAASNIPDMIKEGQANINFNNQTDELMKIQFPDLLKNTMAWYKKRFPIYQALRDGHLIFNEVVEYLKKKM